MTNDESALHPFSEAEVRLASDNYEAQEWLNRELFAAFQIGGLTVEDLSRLLDLPVTVTSEWLAGETDLTMSELRHLATALDARITYRVDHVVNRLPAWLASLDDVGWRDSEWVPEQPQAWQK